MPMTSEVLDFCRERKLFSEHEILLCGVSGGADSMALLHLFHTRGKEVGVEEVICAHLNHGLRGEESDADEAFVRDLSERVGVPFRSEHVDVRARQAETGRRCMSGSASSRWKPGKS